jgi:Holliday junction resolvase RusA-like endonuclease
MSNSRPRKRFNFDTPINEFNCLTQLPCDCVYGLNPPHINGMNDKLIDFNPPGTGSASTNEPIDESDRLDAPVKFFENTFYDKVFLLMLNLQVRTNQSHKRIHVVRYKDVVGQLISAVQLDHRFPYSGDILLYLHFHGTIEQVKRMDVDNMAKPLIDCMKKIVMTDDNRVRMLWVEKSVHYSPGCKVGIKFLQTGEMPLLMPPLYFDETEMASILAEQGLSLDDLEGPSAPVEN